MTIKKAEIFLRAAAVAAGELLALGTVITLLFRGFSDKLLLACGTVVLVLVPELLERLLRCRIHTAVYIFAVLYAIGPMLGHAWKLYYTVSWWDKLLHICGGVMFVILGIYLFERLTRGQVGHTAAVVFALCFSMAVSVVWEFAEYGADRFLGMDMQSDTVVTDLRSYALGNEPGVTGHVEGIHSVTVNGTPLPVDGYIDIGIHDTMLDMFLESLGALITCLILFFDKGRHPLIRPRPKAA